MFNITDLVDPAWCRFSTRDESERRPVVQDLPEHLFPLGSDRSKVLLADFRRFAGCRRSGRARRNRLPRPVRCLLLMLAPPGTPSAPPACLITRPGNQHRFRFGTHSPASFPLFSVTVPSDRGTVRPADEFGERSRSSSSHRGGSLPQTVRTITAWRNGYAVRMRRWGSQRTRTRLIAHDEEGISLRSAY